MSDEWYFQVMGEERGPLTSRQLRERASTGQIERDTLVRKGENGEWVLADSVKGLFGSVEQSNPVQFEESRLASAPSATKPVKTNQPKPHEPEFLSSEFSAGRVLFGVIAAVLLAVLAVCGMLLSIIILESVFHLIVAGTGFAILCFVLCVLIMGKRMHSHPPLALAGWFLIFYGLIWCNYFLISFSVTMDGSIVNNDLMQHREFGVLWSLGVMFIGAILEIVHYSGIHFANCQREN